MQESALEEIVGTSAETAAIRSFVQVAAASDGPVMLLGEPGVGKELIGRRIHFESSRSEEPFLMIDCSLYYERELKREVFGYRGIGPAGRSRRGVLEFASRGTCYFSRVEEMSSGLQSALADFLRRRRFKRLGDGREVASDARLIVASEKNLRGFVEGGLFSLELFEELSALSLLVPPLRERGEDVAGIVESLRDAYSRERPLAVLPEFLPDALDALRCFSWPGNYDELKAEVQRLLATGRREITPDQLSLEIASYWMGRRGDPAVRRVLEELDAFIREFRVLSRLDAEFGDILLDAGAWDVHASPASRSLGEDDM